LQDFDDFIATLIVNIFQKNRISGRELFKDRQCFIGNAGVGLLDPFSREVSGAQ
jgi:hypothetical protein